MLGRLHPEHERLRDPVAAVDLGATSGRVILGGLVDGRLRMRHVARFPNQPVRLHEGDRAGLHWTITELHRSVTAGLAQALRQELGVSRITGIILKNPLLSDLSDVLSELFNEFRQRHRQIPVRTFSMARRPNWR